MIKRFVLTLILIMLPVECFAAFSEVEFGRYYQDANSKELSPIKWLVLDENGEAFLLMTKNCIDEIPYNEHRVNVTWENCSLRKWLNDKFLFLNVAFTVEEQDSMLPVVLSDKVFVLNREEVLQYLPNETDRQCVPTDYSIHRGTYVNDGGLCAWWTRDPAPNAQAVYMSSYGTFGNRPHYVDDKVIGVRPAVEETMIEPRYSFAHLLIRNKELIPSGTGL